MSNDEKLVVLKPGEMKVFSYYKPSLAAGEYTIKVVQKTTAPGQAPVETPEGPSTKKFTIATPRFNIVPGNVYSVYPPPGTMESARVLPHVVLNDPHFPWLRKSRMAPGNETEPTPWVGLVSFETQELEKITGLNLGDAVRPSETFTYRMSLEALGKLRDRVHLTIDPSYGTTSVDDATRPEGEQNADLVDVIFITTELFTSLFRAQMSDNASSPSISLERYKYMSHVRITKPEDSIASGPAGNKLFSVLVSPRSGPIKAGAAPFPMTAHLVSIEGIEDNFSSIISSSAWTSKKFVALVTLHSWSYFTKPTDVINDQRYPDILARLGDGIQPLRQPTSVFESIDQKIKDSATPETKKKELKWLKKRLKAGYSFIRYRPSTGEETLAMYRGVLIPMRSGVEIADETQMETSKGAKDHQFKAASNIGQDLQIIDTDSGVVDLSYNLAWNLGRSLGSADRGFSAALIRLRGRINATAQASFYGKKMGKDRADMLSGFKGPRWGGEKRDSQDQNSGKGKAKEEGSGSSKAPAIPPTGPPATGPSGSVESRPKQQKSIIERWNKRGAYNPVDELDVIPDIELHAEMKKAAADIAGLKIVESKETTTTTAPSQSTGNAPQISGAPSSAQAGTPSSGSSGKATETSSTTQSKEDATKSSDSSSWKTICDWINEKLMLQRIPNIYLYPDTFTLPDEAFRTFYIDSAWMDSFIDGALSVGNDNFYDAIDVIRNEFKRNINQQVFGTGASSLTPKSIAQWGFIIRSKVIAAYPDLRIEIPERVVNGVKYRAKIIRTERLAEDTVFFLLDKRPEDGYLNPNESIKLTEPPHQQRFSIGDSLTSTDLAMKFTLLSNMDAAALKQARGDPKNVAILDYTEKSSSAMDTNRIYDWNTRCLVFPNFANKCFDLPKRCLPNNFPYGASSALTGIQLNDEPMTLAITIPSPNPNPNEKIRGLPLLEYPRPDDGKEKRSTGSAAHITAASRKQDTFSFPTMRSGVKPVKPTLRAALRTVPELASDPSNSVAVGTRSYLIKAVYPLHHYGCNIPTHTGKAIDLVFSISAVPDVRPDVKLDSLTVILSAGRSKIDLLRVSRNDATKLSVLPAATPIGKGSRWLTIARECDGLTTAFDQYRAGSTSTQPATPKKPKCTTTLAVRVAPRFKEGPLKDMPDLSFILAGVEINDQPSAECEIIFQERYSLRQTIGQSSAAAGLNLPKETWIYQGLKETLVKVEKQRG